VPVGGNYEGALVPTKQWINNKQTYGQTGEPWTSPHWHGDIEALDYAGSVPAGEKCVSRLMRYGVHECQGEQEAKDMAAAIAKVDAQVRR
jgi:hypothetical protein